MLEQVANVPLGRPDDDHSEFKVSSPLAAGVDEVQQAIPPPPQGPPPIAHHDIGMAGVKNFVADLVFSDDTMFADVVVNRPGELLRKALSTDRNLTAILNLQSWLSATYNDLRSASGNILQATKVWFYEAIFGSGKFHGDTHSGNLMIGRNDVTFVDFGNLYQLKSNRADGVNERHELVRVIMGAAFRDKDFVLAGFEKLLSPEGKAALAANRKKAEAILESVLSKSKGGFSFNIVYRL